MWYNYKEVAEMAEDLARALEHHKIYSEVMEGTKRKILMCQVVFVRYEQLILTLALWHTGAAIMTETEEARSQPEFHSMGTTAEDLPRILDLKKNGRMNNYDSLLLFDKPKPEDAKTAEELKLKIYLYEDLLKEGKTLKDVKLPGSKRDDLAIIIDTSGTSGIDKSVMLSQYLTLYLVFYTLNFRMTSIGVYQQFEECYSAGTLVTTFSSLCMGGAIAVKSHVFPYLDDVQHSQPDYILMYSNGYQYAYQKMMDYLNTFPTEEKESIEKALSKKIAFINQKKGLVEPELDKILLPLKEFIFGKNLKALVAGGAPLAPGILYSIRAVSAVPFDMLYGQTEVGLVSLSESGDVAGCIGPPCKLRKVKLVEVPKLGYSISDQTDGKPTPRGEVSS